VAPPVLGGLHVVLHDVHFHLRLLEIAQQLVLLLGQRAVMGALVVGDLEIGVAEIAAQAFQRILDDLGRRVGAALHLGVLFVHERLRQLVHHLRGAIRIPIGERHREGVGALDAELESIAQRVQRPLLVAAKIGEQTGFMRCFHQ